MGEREGNCGQPHNSLLFHPLPLLISPLLISPPLYLTSSPNFLPSLSYSPSVSPLPQYPDYHSVVSEPIDLKTIRSKIKRGDYGSLDGLVADMELLFSNCQLFHRRHSEIGKAGLTLKRFFDQRCSDLGLKDLELVAGGGATGRSRLRRRK